MSVYKCKATDLTGKVFVSKLEYDSENEVLNYLKSKQLIPISIKQINCLNQDLKQIKLFKPKVTIKDLSAFCNQFALIIDSSISEILAFDIIIHQIENPSLKTIMIDVYKDIQKGSTISEAMQKHKEIPELMINVIKAGELSGKLSYSFKHLAQQYDRNLESNRKVKDAMTYPLILISILFIAITLITTVVLPNYITMFTEMEINLPPVTLLLIKINDFITRNFYILIGLLVIAFVSKSILKISIFKTIKDNILLKVPLVNKIIIQTNTMLFCQNVSMLLLSGVSIIETLKIVTKLLTNSAFQKSLEFITYEVKKGISLSEAVSNSKLFPTELKNVLKIGEETSFNAQIDMLEKMARLYNADITTEIFNLTKFIEPILTIIIAVIIGFIMLAVIMPTFSLATQLS